MAHETPPLFAALDDRRRRSHSEVERVSAEDAEAVAMFPLGPPHTAVKDVDEGEDGCRGDRGDTFHYVDFIHSREQVASVIEHVAASLAVSVDILTVSGDVSGPTKSQAAAVFSCATSRTPMPPPPPPTAMTVDAGSRPATHINSVGGKIVHCGRL